MNEVTKVSRSFSPRKMHRRVLRGAGVQPAFLMLLSGCSRSPDFNILGSYFPSWIFCMVGGIACAALARLLLLRFKVEYQLRPLALIYTCLACFFACTFWLLFFN